MNQSNRCVFLNQRNVGNESLDRFVRFFSVLELLDVLVLELRCTQQYILDHGAIYVEDYIFNHVHTAVSG